jgi:hypothetical protein
MPGRKGLYLLPKLGCERWALLDIIERKRDKAILAFTRRY